MRHDQLEGGTRLADRVRVVAGHRLLPHEGGFAALILRRQRTHRTTAVIRIEQNYGPDGVALFAAAVIGVIPAQLTAGAGVILVLASHATTGYALLCACVVFG